MGKLHARKTMHTSSVFLDSGLLTKIVQFHREGAETALRFQSETISKCSLVLMKHPVQATITAQRRHHYDRLLNGDKFNLHNISIRPGRRVRRTVRENVRVAIMQRHGLYAEQNR